MNLEEAKKIQKNDKLITLFGENVVVFDFFTEQTDNEITSIIFTVINPETNNISNYYHNILYTNIDQLDSKEQMFIKWCQDNQNERLEYSDLVLIKEVFLTAFDLGIDSVKTIEQSETNESTTNG